MIKIGLTGGIGSGKTTVAKIFELFEVPVYNADIKAKKLMTSNKTLKAQIKKLIGPEAYFRNGRLNRKYIATKVFNDKTLLLKLNGLVHPAVANDLSSWFNLQNTAYAIQEAAIIFEHGSQAKFDYTILVTAPKEMRMERVCLRDKVSPEIVAKRMDAQMSDEEKIKLADFVIVNNMESSLIAQVRDLDLKLKGFSY